MKAGIIRFPGSNCDGDIFYILHEFFYAETVMLWYRDSIEEKYDLLVLPGGFSYGDYLRAGAIARFSPAMESLEKHVKRGGGVLGICNGFQILCEAGFLPGAFIKNRSLKHICRNVLLCPNTQNRFASSLEAERAYKIPISHSEGNYYAEKEVWENMQEKNQIVFRYQYNPNGSTADIAGISDSSMRILGMMPHPERAVDSVTGGTDGRAVIQSVLNAL